MRAANLAASEAQRRRSDEWAKTVPETDYAAIIACLRAKSSGAAGISGTGGPVAARREGSFQLGRDDQEMPNAVPSFGPRHRVSEINVR